MKKFLSIILVGLMVVTMLPMAVLPASAAENLDYNIKLEVVDWAVYETSGELIGEFNAVEHGDAFYDVSLTQADDGTFTCSYQIALERNGGNTAWGESSISFKIDSCEDEFLQEFEKSFYSNYNIYYTLKVTRRAGHADGTATCTTQAVCTVCGESYGEVDTTNHDNSVDFNYNGFCENGCYEPATLVTNENYESFYLKADYVGYYAISNAGQLFWYANYINTVDRTANAVLTADIDLENRPWTPIGSTGENSNNFRGIFDGQYYNIKGLYVEGDRAGLGFFGEVRTGTVKNFIIFGEVVVNTEVDYVGGVIGSICGVNGETDLERNGAIIQNINSYVNLTVKAHGVGKIGGFVGYANHESLIEHCAWYGTFDAGEYRVDNGAGGFIGRIQENSSRVTIRNCGAYGTIKTNYAGDYNDTATIYMGGFLSFSNTSAKTTLENCLFAGKFERGENLTDQAFLGAFGTLRSVNAIKNCYYLGDDGLEAVHSDSDLKPGSDNVEITKVTGEELKSGEVATMLGKLWSQGEDYPILKELSPHSHQYTYTDNGNGTHDATCTACGAVVDNDAHTIENHVCTACGAIEITVSFNAGDYKWKTGDQINFVREVEGIGIDDCVFTATVAEDGTVTWTADKPFCWYGEGEQKLFAAPNNGWSVDYFVIPEDQSTSAKLDEADLVNGMWVGTPTTDTITFNMTHRMAKVTVNYEFAEGVTADISELKVYSIAQICRFSTDDWSIKLTSAGQFDVWVTPYLDGNQFTTFIIPETYATGEDFIKITLSDGTVYEVKMNKAVTFEDGGEYNYKVVITADGAYLTCADECTFEYTDNEDGTHKATCTMCGYVAASENHTLTYSANGNIITESCSANCGYTGTATISAEGKTYDGNAVEVVVSKTGSLENTIIPVTLTKDGEAFTGEPVNAGAYTASVTLGNKTVSVDFTIAKAPLTVTASDATITYGEAPTNNGVTYSGFVNGENENVLGGELAYTYTYTQNGNVGNYSITPEGLTADNYEITFVDGTLTVEQIDIGDIIDGMKINLEQYSYVYDGTEKKPKVTSITVDGVTLTEGTDYTVRYEDNVYVGNYATAVITFEGNYDGTFRKWFTITKAYYNLTAPTPDTLTYNGENQYLVSAGTVEGADFEYSLDGVSWSTSIPQAKDVGNYTVYYRVLADENHYGIEGTVDVTIKECTHTWNEGVLTRPTFETAGYYTYTCTLCGHSYTEPTKKADDTALNDASMKVMEYIGNDTLTQEAKDEIYKSYRDILKNNGNIFDEFGFVRGDLVEEDQPAINAVTAELEKIVADAEEKIASGEYVKADYTEIDEAIASVDEALENATISEEMANELSDIKSQLEALKENENTSMADAAELLERVKAVAETMADCANGIHSFTKYEETEAPMCGVEGKEISYCDHGCGATDERAIPALTHEPLEAVKENEVAPKCGVAGSYDLVVYCDLCGDELDRDTVTVDALTHKDEDGDYLCDHGCGHEFEKPAEPDTPDEPADGDCDHLCHKSGIMSIFWKIINFFFKLFNIQQYCDCGKLHY